jgi:hypothetical protein
MLEKRYDISYVGKIAEGHDIAEVKRNLASIFKTNPGKIEEFFTGKKSVIKKNMTYESAMRYKMAFETAGAVCGVEESKGDLGVPTPHEIYQKESSTPSPPKMMICPECGFQQQKSEQCVECGIIIEKYQTRTYDALQVRPHQTSPLYFAVSKPKLIVMSLCTFGIYEIYWFYKNWKLIKEKKGKNIHPFWRAFFAVLFCHSLFKSIQDSSNSHGFGSDINPGWLAVGYLGLSVTWRLPDPFWLVSLLTFLPLLPAQELVSNIHAKIAPSASCNDRFSGTNITVVILGGMLSLLAILRTFMPE